MRKAAAALTAWASLTVLATALLWPRPWQQAAAIAAGWLSYRAALCLLRALPEM